MILNETIRYLATPLKKKPNVTIILGSQWGDEGKGKIVDLLSKRFQAVCRCQGGSNAGHTVVVNKEKHSFHLLPSGILQKDCINVLGNGVVIHLPTLFDEIDHLGKFAETLSGRFNVSDRAHLVFDFHQEIDCLIEKYKGNKNIGTTKKGIGPAYASKATRNGIRVCDLMGNYDEFCEKFQNIVKFNQCMFTELKVNVEQELERYKEFVKKLKPYVCDTIILLHKLLEDSDKKILIEGANACMLDIDFGTYPYVTSSNCSIGGVFTGLGIPPQSISNCIGVIKAYTTRVGSGPFPTELLDEIGEKLRDRGNEYGSTTNRPRRCGWLDLVVVKYTHLINHYDELVLTKLDILDDFKEIRIAVNYEINGKTISSMPADLDVLAKVDVKYIEMAGWVKDTSNVRHYNDLPVNAKKYIEKIEEILRIPIKWIGVGQDRASIIER